jgi:hypothetical protein
VIHGKQLNSQSTGHAEGFANVLSVGGVLGSFFEGDAGQLEP